MSQQSFMFEYILYQEIHTSSCRRTFFRLFKSMVPPSVGWTLQQFGSSTDGTEVESIHINHRGVCFVLFEPITVEDENDDLLPKIMADLSKWTEDASHWEFWEMGINELRELLSQNEASRPD